MRSEEEIKEALETYEKELSEIKLLYDRYVNTVFEDKRTPMLVEAWETTNARIQTLRWVLTERS